MARETEKQSKQRWGLTQEITSRTQLLQISITLKTPRWEFECIRLPWLQEAAGRSDKAGVRQTPNLEFAG